MWETMLNFMEQGFLDTCMMTEYGHFCSGCSSIKTVEITQYVKYVCYVTFFLLSFKIYIF